MDLSLGITGPIAGFSMSYASVSLVCLLTALLVCLALFCTLRMMKRMPEEAKVEIKESA